ncbi:cysteine-rich with EGF-like domain protein 2 [Sycon ciliatum]|uniref:cysteine-rich with EGF-like domain protein 2 n=1 Tax=Sycon ciliatum TaxID=27933 RepID=UPI0020AE2E52|eukprot:scpid66540/ scgid12657/ Cysteine-rich with EGF-like domain protein 2
MLARTVLVPAILASLWLTCCLRIATAEDSTTKCGACKKLVEDFAKGKERTARDNFAGGDVAWEEEKQLSYATSETRLIEIMEGVCTKDHKCQYLIEEHEELVETWWFENQKKHPDLQLWLCIQNIKVCCPEGTFGKKCAECPGGSSTPCSGQGTCDGAGDRAGKGTCSCNSGYGGRTCGKCSAGYYVNASDTASAEDTPSSSVQCLRCSSACEKNCTGATPSDCEDCADGYEEEGGTCLDQDECLDADKAPCKNRPSTYCRNTAGSYECAACDTACKDSCTGRGADKCSECASGYQRDDSTQACQDVDECKDHQSRWLPPPRPEDPNQLYPGCNFTTYCHNTIGSFECRDCDSSCDGCKGNGRDSCLKCAGGYVLQDSMCSDVDECSQGDGVCEASVQVCVNTAGSFRCDCAQGHELVADKCQPEPEQAPDYDDDSDDDDDFREKDEL